MKWQMSRTDNDEVLEDYTEEVRREKIMNGEISLLGVMQVRSRHNRVQLRPRNLFSWEALR